MAISIRVKYVAQLVDEWLCVYVRRGKEPYHDPTLNTWEYDFFERLPRDLTRSGMYAVAGDGAGRCTLFPRQGFDPLPTQRKRPNYICMSVCMYVCVCLCEGGSLLAPFLEI